MGGDAQLARQSLRAEAAAGRRRAARRAAPGACQGDLHQPGPAAREHPLVREIRLERADRALPQGPRQGGGELISTRKLIAEIEERHASLQQQMAAKMIAVADDVERLSAELEAQEWR